MRRFSLALLGSVFYATAAIAAEPGTYRPGNAYNSISANSADVCELQCAGDAQCRSWNFIRVSKTNDGVCEFNENSANPVASSVSISGANVSRAASTKLVSGRTNTVRVGAPSVTQPSSSVTQPSATRRVVREPVPARIQTRTAGYSAPRPNASPQNTQHLSLTQQQNMHRQHSMARTAHSQPMTAPRQNPNSARQAPQSYNPRSQASRSQAQRPQTSKHQASRPQVAAPRQMFRHNLDEPGAQVQRQRQVPQQRPQQAHMTRGQRPTGQARTGQRSPSAPYQHADPRLTQKLQQAELNQPNYRQRPPAASAATSYRPQTQPQTTQQPQAQPSARQGGLSAPPGVPPMAPSQQPNYTQPAQPTLAGRPTLAKPAGAQSSGQNRPSQAQIQAQQAQAHAAYMARAQAAAQRRVHIPSELSPRPMGAAEATESLFGSLYDDVKIPAQIDPGLINDPDAPIPTVSSVPTGQIMSAPLPPVR